MLRISNKPTFSWEQHPPGSQLVEACSAAHLTRLKTVIMVSSCNKQDSGYFRFRRKACEFGELTLAIDLETARTYYHEAVHGGYGDAQERLGKAYEFGELTLAIDLEAARTCYREAAEGSDGDAQERLAYAYKNGELDLAIDHEAALMWLKIALRSRAGGDEEEDEEEEEEEQEEEEEEEEEGESE